MDWIRKSFNHPLNLIWVALAYVPLLWLYSVPLTGDQKVYISVAMEMWERGEWVYPVLFGEHNYLKPPLQYWATLLGWAIFGFNLFGTLLPSVLAVMGTSWFIGEISQVYLGRSKKITAGLWFAAAAGTVTYGTTAQMEIYLVLFFTAATWAALKFIREARFGFLYLAFMIAGASALIKSPLYSVLWVGGFSLFLVWTRRWRVFTFAHFWGALASGVSVGLSWFVWVYIHDGELFWAKYVVEQSVAKQHGNGSTIWRLWFDYSTFCVPFLLLVFPAAWSLWRSRSSELIKIVVAWSAPAAFFFSYFPYRTETYLYLILPFFVLIVDWGIRKSDSVTDIAFKWAGRLTGLIVLALVGVVSLVLVRAEMIPPLAGTGFFLTGLLWCVYSFRNQWQKMALASLLAVLFFRISAVSIGELDVAGLKKIVAESPSRSLAFFDEGKNVWHEVGLLSAVVQSPSPRLGSTEAVAEAIDSGKMVVLSPHQFSILEDLRTRFDEPLVEKEWRRWKKRGGFPFKKLILEGRAGIEDWDDRFYRVFKVISK